MALLSLANDTETNKCVRLQLHCAIYRPDSFVLMSRHCANLKAIRYESTSLNRIVADKSYRVIVAFANSLKLKVVDSFRDFCKVTL